MWVLDSNSMDDLLMMQARTPLSGERIFEKRESGEKEG
jgi:hypothetical protein